MSRPARSELYDANAYGQDLLYCMPVRRIPGYIDRYGATPSLTWTYVGSDSTATLAIPAKCPSTDPRADAETKKPRRSGASPDGRGWFRTSDLSRVKRALSH